MKLAKLKNQKGQGLVEYALIIVLVAIAAIAALNGLQGSTTAALNNAAGQLNPVAG